jgi:hypothetical protein
VVVGGLSSGNTTWLSSLIQAPTGLFADAVGVHSYNLRPLPNWPSPNWGQGNLIDYLQQYLPLVSGASVPLWITELSTDDLQYQGEYPYKAFTAVNNTVAAQVPTAFWFCYSDGMISPFGLLAKNGTEKAAYYSFGTFAGYPYQGVSLDMFKHSVPITGQMSFKIVKIDIV